MVKRLAKEHICMTCRHRQQCGGSQGERERTGMCGGKHRVGGTSVIV